MAYIPNTLISRRGYSNLDGWTDTVGDVAKGALSFFGSQQRAAGQAEAMAQVNKDLLAAQQAQQGISTEVLLIGGVAVGAALFLILRKKK